MIKCVCGEVLTSEQVNEHIAQPLHSLACRKCGGEVVVRQTMFVHVIGPSTWHDAEVDQ